MAHLPWKKPLDFGSNPNHVTLGLAGLGLGLGEGYITSAAQVLV